MQGGGNEVYDVLVIGGGVTGTAIAHVLTFTNIGKAVLLEKNEDVALVNSNTVNNAQTLHGGDTETNFSLEKALKMREAEMMLAAFLEKFGQGAFLRLYKMVIGVGAKEIAFLRDRFRVFKPHYPNLRFLEGKDLEKIEPVLLDGRRSNEPVAALYREPGYAVDYHKLARCFMREAKKSGKIKFVFKIKTQKIIQRDGCYEVHTNKGIFYCRVLIAAAGPYSLLFAHDLGHARDYAILPVAGSFYQASRLLKGKVYTVQNPKLPFAAPHADPAVHDAEIVRFGPTAKALPFLERYHWWTLFDFMKSGILSFAGIASVFSILKDPDTLMFILKNIVYDIPIIGKLVFLKKAARKIIPTLRFRDLTFIRGAGGIRPQLINIKEGRLEMGTGKFLGERAVFNITPSPGASDCLRNAIIDVRHAISFLGPGFKFDEEAFRAELGLSSQKGGVL